MIYIESHIQSECLKWFKLQYRELTYIYLDEKNKVHHCSLLVKNCNEGSKSDTRRMIEFSEGLTPGVADMSLKVANNKFHGMEIEFKKPGGKQRESQKSYQYQVEKQGYYYVVVDSFDKFKKEIDLYLQPYERKHKEENL